jgi:hypothetical protein
VLGWPGRLRRKRRERATDEKTTEGRSTCDSLSMA